MKRINIREITFADAEQLQLIDSICFAPDIAYSFTDFLNLLKHINQSGNSGIKGCIIEAGSKTAGFIIARQTGLQAEVITIDILPEFRRKGYAKKLLKLMENYLLSNTCKFIYLEVAVTNKPAVKLYEKLGYNIVKKIDSYYPGNIPAFLMIKII